MSDAPESLGLSTWHAAAPGCGDLSRPLPEPESGARESYGLTWPGKAAALRLAELPTASTLRARTDHAVAEQTATHAVVEGENLDVLKLLRASCPGCIDLVYIDPPYNRGHDRAYADDFATARISAKDGADPRQRHARWLDFMAPRLVLARDLLSERGVLAVSIDQREAARLRLLLEELFGEQDFVAEIVVSLNPKGRQLAPFFATSHEYLMIVARDASKTALVPATRDAVDLSDFPLCDEVGKYRLLPLRNTNKKFHPGTSPTLHFPLFAHPTDGRVAVRAFDGAVEVLPVFGDGSRAVWRWSTTRVAEETASLFARIVRGPNGDRLDVFQIDRCGDERTKKLRTIWTSDEIGSTDDASRDLKALVGPVFPTPKPVGLVRRLLACMPKDSVVLDFFAGSGTTGQAVIEANHEDGGTRRCVLVQAPEPTAKDGEAATRGLDTIAAITRARLRATIERVRASSSGSRAPSDGSAREVGFRAFELAMPGGLEHASDDELLFRLLRES